MSFLSQAMLVVFIGCAVVAAAGWIYSARYHLPLSLNRVRDEPRKSEYRRRSWNGRMVFIAAWALAWMAGLVAWRWAGGW